MPSTSRRETRHPLLSLSSHNGILSEGSELSTKETYRIKLGCGDLGISHLMLVFTKVKSTDCPRTRPSSTVVSLSGD